MTNQTQHTCASCGAEAEVLALTEWQMADTDALDGEISDEQLEAEGARWLCIDCSNDEQ